MLQPHDLLYDRYYIMLTIGADEIVGDRVRYVAAEIERAKATDRPERYGLFPYNP